MNAFFVIKNFKMKKDTMHAGIVKDAFVMLAILIKHLEKNFDIFNFY